MKTEILFIQGGGNGGYEADAKLVASLRKALGTVYEVHYPKMPSAETAPDFGWLKQISKEIFSVQGEIILVGHSFGASMLLKYLSENKIKKNISGIFLISTPFWSGDEDWVQGLKLREDFTDQLPTDIPVFLYHCLDDEVAPFDHLKLYKQRLPRATVREIASGGHQLNNDLSLVAGDIKSLKE